MLVFSVPFQSPVLLMPSAHAATVVSYQLLKQSEMPVTSGVRQIDYKWVASDSSPTEMIHVLKIDLTDPYVELNAMGGKGGSVTAGQSVTGMTKETKAVAGVNGDVFGTANEGAPIGAQIKDGELQVSTSQLNGMYAFAITNDRKPMIDNFTFSGTVTAESGNTFALAGINKSLYWAEPGKTNSHVNALYMYTNEWTAPQRPAGTGTTPTEALVVDGVVTEVVPGQEITTPVPPNGYILRGHGTAAKFITDNLYPGVHVSSEYNLKSQTTGQTFDPSFFKMMVSGHTILVDQGKAAAFSRDIAGVSGASSRARTAVGYSQDGNTAYLVTVEENGGRNGVPLKELQDIMVRIGAWKAVNMDGGGSTTMVARPLGEFNVALAHPTSAGTYQRPVANGIGVYTTAPQGELKGIVASGPKTVFMGQETRFSLKAYDSYYNPIDPKGLNPVWNINPEVGYFKDGLLIANKPGKTTVKVTAGSTSSSIGVEVLGEAAIDRLTVQPSSMVLRAGAVINVPVKARLKDGSETAVAPTAIKWEFKGFKGKVSNGQLTIESVENNAAVGYAIARYDGFGTAVVLTPGSEKSFETFENVTYPLEFKGLPAELAGSASVVSGLPGRESSNALSLKYDFTNGTGSRFAYAVMNAAGGGVPVEGSPSALTLDVMGDSSLNYLRAEFVGADGKAVMVDVSRIIDWSGWKTIRVDLAAAGVKGPAKLTKLYVVNLAEGQDERALQGEVAFDNLTLQYPPSPVTTTNPTIVMKLGSAKATVNGKSVTLPAPVFSINGNSYLPLKFVAEAMGADVGWEASTKRVTVLRGSKMIDLWIGKSELAADGVRQKINAEPVIRNSRTYVPLRIVSEQLGQKVTWDEKTRTITIR
ncbi:copper amine oxidase [Cohnella pontilimi]|uniref:Copper amine oxidase n=2 Tax=Cohnella pontilimi TaxID=2564100 RepID=A0A4U0FBP1_9BACL|nr:copper amine oxidase [Cohnella pontilimi]